MTLAIGVAVSMFTAITVTRTFLRTIVGTGIRFSPALFGVQAPQRGAGETVRAGTGTAQPVGA